MHSTCLPCRILHGYDVRFMLSRQRGRSGPPQLDHGGHQSVAGGQVSGPCQGFPRPTLGPDPRFDIKLGSKEATTFECRVPAQQLRRSTAASEKMWSRRVVGGLGRGWCSPRIPSLLASFPNLAVPVNLRIIFRLSCRSHLMWVWTSTVISTGH